MGGLLGAGLTWMSTTKKGKEMRGQILEYSADVYADVKEKVMASDAWDNMTKSKYVAMVNEAVEKYAGKTGMADSLKGIVVKLVNSQWKELQSEQKKKKK